MTKQIEENKVKKVKVVDKPTTSSTSTTRNKQGHIIMVFNLCLVKQGMTVVKSVQHADFIPTQLVGLEPDKDFKEFEDWFCYQINKHLQPSQYYEFSMSFATDNFVKDLEVAHKRKLTGLKRYIYPKVVNIAVRNKPHIKKKPNLTIVK